MHRLLRAAIRRHAIAGIAIMSCLGCGVVGQGLGCGHTSRADTAHSLADHGVAPAAGGAQSGPVVEPVQIKLARDPAGTPHPRIALDPPTLARLRKLAKAHVPAWNRLESKCNELTRHADDGGYVGWQWGQAVASLALCWRATGNKHYAERAVFYTKALLDDMRAVGDGAGGDAVIDHDHGYPIRTHGTFSALAYDWLYDAPGMTPALRAKIRERLTTWLGWYAQDGYLKADPFANYFWGYFSTLTFAGIALDGDTPAASSWLAKSRELLGDKIIPGFGNQLRGGDWAEGWQYGAFVAAELSLVVRAYQTAAGVDLGPKFPWLGQAVLDRLHALRPDRRSMYGNGTHGHKPPPPNPIVMSGLLMSLNHIDPHRAAQARFIDDKLYPEERLENVWMPFLAARLHPKEIDPRKGAPLSHLIPGPGITFMRSDWSKHAVWAVLQAGPHISVDHQSNDQGHFELWRGSDGLLISGGDGPATVNFNTLLIDDGGKALSYPGNQGGWGKHSRTLLYGDDGRAVVAVGDITDAWDPGCVRSGCKLRAVTKVIRTLVYVRPNLLVVDDDVVLTRPSTKVAWAAHTFVPPKDQAGDVFAIRGDSRVDIRTLAPERAVTHIYKEPTNPQKTYIWLADRPYTDVWRVQVESPLGTRERRFTHWITANASSAKPPVARAVSGDGLRGAYGTTGQTKADGTRATVAVLFSASPTGGSVDLGTGGADTVVVVGLVPGGRYRVSAARGSACRLSIARGGSRRADSGGALSVPAAGCKIRR